MSQLRSFSDVITIAQLDVGVSLMAHKEWKENEKYFKSYNDKNSNSLYGVERIDLKSPVIIIPIIYETMKCIIIRHRYFPATEKESSTNNEIEKKNHHHDFYCIYSHRQSNTQIKEFEEHYQNTELFKENDCTSIRWKDIHIEEETQCLSTCLYALMTNFLGIVGSVKKCFIDQQVIDVRDIQDVVCEDIVSVFANNEFMNERTILSSDKWIQENDLQGKMIQNRISEKSFISTYGTNQGLNGIWNYDESKVNYQGNFCYMNSVMRCFAQINVFREYFLENKFTANISSQKEVCFLFRAMCCFMYEDTYPSDAMYQHKCFDDMYFEGKRDQEGEISVCIILLHVCDHLSYKNTELFVSLLPSN